MALKQRSGRHHENVHIDVVPMVDCMLVLVIFLMVSSVFVASPGVEVDRPDVSGGEEADRNFLLLAITADDRIFFDGQEIQLEQVAPLVKQAAFSHDQALIIQADKAASHGMFAKVYAEGKKAGIANVQFATARAD
ncbi:MAG TPA: biopolymer transporter ExbD [Opitutaceae bacterium]|nr:biopolymer transporter ExbD [Opitutaceae bacterium]